MEQIKKLIPTPIKNYIKRLKYELLLVKAYIYDYKRYYKYSATKGVWSERSLRAQIIKDYHGLEKGLTMPVSKPGMGKARMISLCDKCEEYIRKYNSTNKQLVHAISVILEYKHFNEKGDATFDKKLNEKLSKIEEIASKLNIKESEQKKIARNEYFKYTASEFDLFSNSRKSTRNFSTIERVPIESLKQAIALAQNAPSACNRQSAKVYVYRDKQKIESILKCQNGNRGFGHLADTLILIVADVSAFALPLERYQAFIDGGIYAMNLLHSLHFHKIAACILNCSNTPSVDLRMRKASGIKESEVIISLVACGIPPEELAIGVSLRESLEDVCTIID